MTALPRPRLSLGVWLVIFVAPVAGQTPAVTAVDWQRQEVYRAPTKPAYTSWVSLFPGNDGEWYLSFEQVTQPDPPLPLASLDVWYRMSLPDGYDKSPYLMEVVLLKSDDQCTTWKEISRQPVRYHHSAGSFGQARTSDGRFLRAMWNCYHLDEPLEPGRFLYESRDEGKTWEQLPPVLDDRFCPYPHRMKQLNDGTIVLAVPYGPMWAPQTAIPVRGAKPANVVEDFFMSLLISTDEGRTWDGPIPIFPRTNCSETDFVELPSGDLLAFVNSIFGQPGRQVIHRVGDRFVPGQYELIQNQYVPECVVLTKEGVLVGSMRNGSYYWSDDEGLTWQVLDGARSCEYQPMIRQLADGRIVCAWHLGADDAIASADQYIGLDLFRLKVNRKTAKTNLTVERKFAPADNRFLNEYVATLTADAKPLPDKRVTLWYVLQNEPGYDGFNRGTLAERMAQGGKTVEATTDANGQAHFALPELDAGASVHLHYHLAVVFNADRSDPAYVPAASAICPFYTLAHGNGAPAETLKTQ